MDTAVDVWVAAWQDAYPSIDFGARRGWAAQHIAGLEKSGALSSVAVCGNAIVGLVVVDPAIGYLDQIVVATEQQGTGVAEALLAHACALSPKGVDLHVNQDNARAIAFYQKHGFVISGADVNVRSGAPTHKMSWRRQ
ncbi:MAG: GNAT family N-acetyltransferase [Xanthobacteraceae bacterium]